MKMLIIILLSLSWSIAQESAPWFKGQKKSSFKWGELDLKSFFSVQDWILKADEEEVVKDWEKIARERDHREIVGRFFKCVEACRIYRDDGFFKPSYETAIYEGDEVSTFKESFAWIFLLDGTMVRLAPSTSINFNEFNVGEKENFINARINHGNILWLARNTKKFNEINERETDVLFFPLPLYQAQPKIEVVPYQEESLLSLVEEKNTVLNQYQNLNQLIEKNNLWVNQKPTFSFLVVSNVTIMGYNLSLDLVGLLGGKTYFKNRSATTLGLEEEGSSESNASVSLRGFENSEIIKLNDDQWMEVDQKGKMLSPAEDYFSWLVAQELITKRIPSMMVARELMLEKYSEFAFLNKYGPKELALNYGYRLWGPLDSKEPGKASDLKMRLDFLLEYFRRSETTNLLVYERFVERLKERGENYKTMEYGNYFFQKALESYYFYKEVVLEDERGEVLNSTKKILWKKRTGVR